MSEQANSRTLLLEARELAVLLAGCGIAGLYLPNSVSRAVAADSDVTEAMMGLTRDGLMAQADDGVLDYAPDLRDILRTLRDCRMSVLLWAGWLGDQPRYLHLSYGQDRAVEIMDDPLKPGSVRVRMVELEPWCQSLVSASAKVDVESVEAPRALEAGLVVGPIATPGVLFAAWCFRRGSERPRQLVRAHRLVSGPVLTVDPTKVNETIPLDATKLVELMKEVDGK